MSSGYTCQREMGENSSSMGKITRSTRFLGTAQPIPLCIGYAAYRYFSCHRGGRNVPVRAYLLNNIPLHAMPKPLRTAVLESLMYTIEFVHIKLSRTMCISIVVMSPCELTDTRERLVSKTETNVYVTPRLCISVNTRESLVWNCTLLPSWYWPPGNLNIFYSCASVSTTLMSCFTDNSISTLTA